MDFMPEWYKLTRSAFLLLQSVIGVLLVSYPLKKRSWFFFRLLLGTALGFGLMTLAGNHIYLRGCARTQSVRGRPSNQCHHDWPGS